MKTFAFLRYNFSADLFRPEDILNPGNSSLTFDRVIKFDAQGIGGSNLTITTPEVLNLDWTVQNLRDYYGRSILPTSATGNAAYMIRSQRPVLSPSGSVEVYVYTLARV